MVREINKIGVMMMKWLEAIMVWIGPRKLRIAVMTVGVLAILVVGAICSQVQERQGSDAAIMPFILLILSFAILQVTKHENSK
ncbi:hypothetical protein EBB07_13850 [Paenibacillaceae bacterium]|nr:hypothetical protein EBB07_13850 [Paenibacillaceae bacterium]